MAKKKVVVDTNVLIALFRNRKDVFDFAVEQNIDKIYITYPTYIEFLAGAKKIDKRWSKNFLDSFSLLTASTKSDIVGKTLCMQQQISGKGKCTDLLIASICIANKKQLVTSNFDDFNFKGLSTIKYTP
ncbi:type II toxin-antitoxin system VapC family toxin [Parasediminibacterium sp. JCM 36343]|uniref:type II toxin-antitoxin system VapC family toxin n=1 Tax=Parasediminibacterium sp. JCM 36343 TaxID=3374279 RepID=UPI003978E5C9